MCDVIMEQMKPGWMKSGSLNGMGTGAFSLSAAAGLMTETSMQGTVLSDPEKSINEQGTVGECILTV